MTTTEKTLSGYSDLFKRTYGEWGTALYGSGVEDPLEGMLVKKFGLGGEDLRFPIQTTFGGSSSFGTLGTANYAKHVTPVVSPQKAYARLLLDRMTMKTSAKSDQAFKRAYDYEVQNKVKNFTRIQAMALYNKGDMVLGQFGAAATGSAAAPVITILTTGDYRFRPAYFEEGDIVQVESDVGGTPALEASKFEITAINTSTRAITLSRLTGSVDLTGGGFNSKTHNLVLENSSFYDTGATGASTRKVPQGLLTAHKFTTGSMYGVSYTRRFGLCHTIDASSKLLTTDLLNRAVTEYQFKNGSSPRLIVVSYKQYELFINQEETKKRYTVGSVTGSSSAITKVRASFPSAVFDSAQGSIDIVRSRYVRDDMVFIIEPSRIERHHVEGFGWFDEDNSILLRSSDADSYEARYGGYYENFINPFYVATIENLATS